MKNYLKVDSSGVQYATKDKPVYGLGNTRPVAEYNPDVFVNGKWWSSSNGAEKVANGKFETDVLGWSSDTTNGSSTSFSWSNGTMQIVRSTGNAFGYGEPYQAINVTVGKKYKITANNPNIHIGITYTLGSTYSYGNGGEGYEFVAEQPVVYVIALPNTTGTFYLDNYSVFESTIEPDVEYPTALTYLPYEVEVTPEGNVTDVEYRALPTVVEKYVRADILEGEMRGKNSCTAWVNFDGTTTPPTIKDSYNVSKIIDFGSGYTRIYFEEEMTTKVYSGTVTPDSNKYGSFYSEATTTTKYVDISTWTSGGIGTTSNQVMVTIIGGKE